MDETLSTRQPALVPPTRIDFSEEDGRWIADRIVEVLATGRLTLGPYTEAFERDFAALVGARHAVAVNSGTSALEISLRALDVAGKDVLVPANTFFATAAAVMAAGARPVLMDSDLGTMSTATDEIGRRITAETAGIVIVHIAGFVTDEMSDILRAADEHDLWVLEDAAHAHGSTLSGRHAGTFGIAGTFSFYPTKVMTSAEGGMIVTGDDRLAQEARLYRDQGKAGFLENRHVRLGSNWRLSEPHAIIGLRHLTHLREMVEARRRIAAVYDEALAAEDLVVTPLAAPRAASPTITSIRPCCPTASIGRPSRPIFGTSTASPAPARSTRRRSTSSRFSRSWIPATCRSPSACAAGMCACRSSPA